MAEDFQSIIDAARQGVPPVAMQPGALLFSPADGRTISLEAYMPTPARKRGVTTVFDADSFNIILSGNAHAPSTVIYVDRDVNNPQVVAVLNDHGAEGPGWRDHRVQIAFRPTPQWIKWKSIDGKMLPQETFAEFVEDNLGDVSDPVGGQLLEIVTYLEATRTVNFKSAVRLSNGVVQFQNAEDVQASVSVGKIAVPETFTLGIAPFLGTPLYKVPARFRYRLKDGKLTLGFKLQRIEDLIAEVLDTVVQKVGAPGYGAVIEGAAPAAVTA